MPKRKKILFICTGNTCRSPMAEKLLKAHLDGLGLKGFTVDSAGISAKRGDTINPKSAQVLAENGLDCTEFHSTPLTEKLLREAFAIVCMTGAQRDYLLDMRWNALRKAGVEEIENNVYSFYEITGYDVLDPYGRDIDCYRYVYGLLSAGIPPLIEKLQLKEHAYVPKTKSASTKRTPKKSGDTTPKKRGRPKKTESTPKE